MKNEDAIFGELIEVAHALVQQNEYDEVLRLVGQKATQLLDAEATLILMINPRTRNTVKTLFRESVKKEDRAYRSIQTHISGWIIKNNRPFSSVDIHKDDRFKRGLFQNTSIKCVLGVPIRIEGITIGTLVLLKEPTSKSDCEGGLKLLDHFMTIAAPYLRNTQKIQNYFGTPLPGGALIVKYEQIGLIGSSKKYMEMLHAIEAAARCDVRVLLEGQSGTGKELVAKAIHHFSERGEGPFIAIDCGAIPENLMESELFGYIKGTFTGAHADRIGLMEEAKGGTFFMDEIANLPLPMQTKLMRVLQEGEVRPLGSNKSRKIDVRIITASSSSLRQLVQTSQFREDLYYRLHVYPINVPSLNARCDDIPLLAEHFLKKFAASQNKRVERFHESILSMMGSRQWSGNIRELENFVERMVTLAPPSATVIARKHLPEDLHGELQNNWDENYSLQERLQEVERKIIIQVLDEFNWNQSKAARKLRISERNIRFKMSKLNIQKPTNS